MYNPFILTGKNILVTGASSGIGRSVAIECSRMGARVMLCGRDRERLDETLSKMEGEGHEVVAGDITREYLLITKFMVNKIDGFVNCAGIANTMLFQFLEDEAMKTVMEVNFFAPARICRSLLQEKKINKGASIVFISSISGVLCSGVGNSIYSASKGALNGLVKGMALDLAPKGIRVNTVIPGMINTDFMKNGLISEEQLEQDKKKYPLKRYGEPREVAYAVIYLLSDTTRWVTASNLLIDGGYTAL